MPTVAYTATLDGSPVNAGWSVDRGDIGTIAAGPVARPRRSRPTGTTGGLVTVIAGPQRQDAHSARSMVKLTAHAERRRTRRPRRGRADRRRTSRQLTAGGGVGGVGGEGLGAAVTDPATLAALGDADRRRQRAGARRSSIRTTRRCGRAACSRRSSCGAGRTGDADAIQIELKTTSGSFSWTGTFARPGDPGADGRQVHPPSRSRRTCGTWRPTPRAARRRTAARPAHGEPHRRQGRLAYGPITQTWTVAPGAPRRHRLLQLVRHAAREELRRRSRQQRHQFGARGARRSRSGDTGPKLVVGQDSRRRAASDDDAAAASATWSRRDGRGSSCSTATATARSSALRSQRTPTPRRRSTLTHEGVFGWAAIVGDGTLRAHEHGRSSSTTRRITASRLYTLASGSSARRRRGDAAVCRPTSRRVRRRSRRTASTSRSTRRRPAPSTHDGQGPLVVATTTRRRRRFSQRSRCSHTHGRRTTRAGFPAFLPTTGRRLPPPEVAARASATRSP